MLIILNAYSCGGTLLQKFEKIKDFLPKGEIFISDEIESLKPVIEKSVESGNKFFIAAGGDGTINWVLSTLLSIITKDKLEELGLGAIGIGSSNDFHKPVINKILDIPVKIDFSKANKRDIGCITFHKNDCENKKYFINNASIGITANANYLFYNPDRLLDFLKRYSTSSAIYYSALKTILEHNNFKVDVSFEDGDHFSTELTNLAIIKNPNISGNLSYGNRPIFNNGKFDFHLCYEMKLTQILYLLLALANQNFSKVKNTLSRQLQNLSISSSREFLVEFDGEVIKTKCAQFSILQNKIRVCQ